MSESTLSRLALQNMLFKSTGKDVDKECGYPADPDFAMYWNLYNRNSIAARAVDLYPDDTWEEEFQIVEKGSEEEETPWEATVVKLLEDTDAMAKFHELDVVTGIGKYGALLIGYDDVQADADFIKPAKAAKVLYLHVLMECNIMPKAMDSNRRSPRFGLPETYEVTMQAVTDASAVVVATGVTTTQKVEVHHSRVVWCIDNPRGSRTIGTSRLERVLNNVLDLKKVCGGSAEMFWRGGYTGLFLSLDTDTEMDDDQKKEMDAQTERYMATLQRMIRMANVTPHLLSPTIADPTPHFDLQIDLVSIGIGAPRRIFLGKEAGTLGAEGQQETIKWNKQINRRRKRHATPRIIKPFIDSCIAAGVLAPMEYVVEWGSEEEMTPIEQANRAAKLMEAIAKYAASNVDWVCPPLVFWTYVVGLPQDQAERIVDEAEKIKQASLDAQPDPADLVAEALGHDPMTLDETLAPPARPKKATKKPKTAPAKVAAAR